MYILCVCMCVWVFVSIYTYIFSGQFYFIFSLFLPELNVRESVYVYMFENLCMKFDSVCVSVCECVSVCVKLGSV